MAASPLDMLIPEVKPSDNLDRITRSINTLARLVNGLIRKGQVTRTAQDTWVLGGGGGPPLDVPSGGTGDSTLTDHSILLGNGVNPVEFLGPVESGRVIVSAGTSADPVFTPTPVLGLAGTTTGTIGFSGKTSGVVTVQPQAAAGTFNFNLPTGAGTSGQPLLSGGGGSAAQTYGTLSVSGGGTGRSSLTSNNLLVGAGTSVVTLLDATANPNSVLVATVFGPFFQTDVSLGVPGSTLGLVRLAGNTSGTVTIQPQAAAGTFNFNLPITAGTAGQVLTSQAGGSTAMTWTTPTTGTVTAVSVASANGFAGSSSGGATPALTLSTTVTGILQGNGTAISAASTTGSGAVVLANTPTLITPNIGAATGTSLAVTGLLSQAPAAFTDLTKYLRTNAGNQASTSDLNPGVVFFDSGGFGFGCDLGYNATSARYRTRVFSAFDVALSYGSGATGQSSFTDGLIMTGGTGVIQLPAYTTDGFVKFTGSNGTLAVDTGSYPRRIFQHYADVGNVGTGEDDLYSDTLTAGLLASDGDSVEFWYQGLFNGAALSSQDLRVRFAGTLIYDSGALSIGVATDSWTVVVRVLRESSSVVRCSVSVSTDFATLFPYSAYTRITGLTLSNTQILKITGEAAGAGAANDQIVAKESAGYYAKAA